MHLQRNELETKAQYLFFKCSGAAVIRFQRNYYSNKVQTLDKCDVMLFSGVKILFRVGLVLLKCTLGSQEKLKACQGLYETMELLRAIQPQYIQESFLVHEVHLHFCHKDVVCKIHFYCFDPAPIAHSAIFPFLRLCPPLVTVIDLTCNVLEYYSLTHDSHSFSPCVSGY